jgi:hypothetical protein
MSSAAANSLPGLDFSSGNARRQTTSGPQRHGSAAPILAKVRSPPPPCTTPPAWRCAMLFTAVLYHWECPSGRNEPAHNVVKAIEARTTPQRVASVVIPSPHACAQHQTPPIISRHNHSPLTTNLVPKLPPQRGYAAPSPHFRHPALPGLASTCSRGIFPNLQSPQAAPKNRRGNSQGQRAPDPSCPCSIENQAGGGESHASFTPGQSPPLPGTAGAFHSPGTSIAPTPATCKAPHAQQPLPPPQVAHAPPQKPPPPQAGTAPLQQPLPQEPPPPPAARVPPPAAPPSAAQQVTAAPVDAEMPPGAPQLDTDLMPPPDARPPAPQQANAGLGATETQLVGFAPQAAPQAAQQVAPATVVQQGAAEEPQGVTGQAAVSAAVSYAIVEAGGTDSHTPPSQVEGVTEGSPPPSVEGGDEEAPSPFSPASSQEGSGADEIMADAATQKAHKKRKSRNKGSGSAKDKKMKWSADQPPPALLYDPHHYSYEQ